MKLPSVSKNNPIKTATTLARSSSWPWPPYCHQPKTLSFRGGDDLFRTVNSAFLDSPPDPPGEKVDDGYTDGDEDDSIETVIQGARSEGRLFFEPAGETSSVLAAESEEGPSGDEAGEELVEGVAMCVLESRDPYSDFRKSMVEMVEAHALRGKWDSLEDLLRCYLKINDRTNHAYIFGAFVDLLLSSSPRRTNAFTDTSEQCCNCDNTNDTSSDGNNIINPHSTSSPFSPLSFYTSSSSCCSSTDSLSTTACCVSVVEEAEENSSSGDCSTKAEKQCLPSRLKVTEPSHNREGMIVRRRYCLLHQMSSEILSGN
ncbi:transcription repressor OFP15-like [Punica granatum]|uniref:Transcription repressor n=2 Tax=Punica granatum TaxID=22663 RepID=A0A218XBG9_PUNGR|nr:transcription repressor OFP15-like [Punica granatum]OWM82565.1 hypothetical protein CDL15_Pgr002140 [Punica granatum]PKI47019.1 hypothetical protein CRG98_032558 [Punica granatum]